MVLSNSYFDILFWTITEVSILSAKSEGFRKAIWPVVAFVQLFGTMPIYGIRSQSITDLRFKWKSFRTIYGLFVVMLTTGYALIHLRHTLSRQFDFYTIGVLNEMYIGMYISNLIEYFQ